MEITSSSSDRILSCAEKLQTTRQYGSSISRMTRKKPMISGSSGTQSGNHNICVLVALNQTWRTTCSIVCTKKWTMSESRGILFPTRLQIQVNFPPRSLPPKNNPSALHGDFWGPYRSDFQVFASTDSEVNTSDPPRGSYSDSDY